MERNKEYDFVSSVPEGCAPDAVGGCDPTRSSLAAGGSKTIVSEVVPRRLLVMISARHRRQPRFRGSKRHQHRRLCPAGSRLRCRRDLTGRPVSEVPRGARIRGVDALVLVTC